jgi:hypothetical protein
MTKPESSVYPREREENFVQQALIALCVILLLSTSLPSTSAAAHSVDFKSPGASMHFTAGQPIIVFADLFDSNDEHGMIVCPTGQTINDLHGVAGPATCLGGGTPTGWPQFQVLVDGVLQTDGVTHGTTVPGTTDFDNNMNPDPINFHRFSVSGLAVGTHQMTIRGLFAPPPASNGATLDSAPITIVVEPLPIGRTTLSLGADISGAINWTNLIVIGNGHTVTANGAVVIANTLVTGLGSASSTGISGTVASLDIEGSVFEATAALDLTTTGNATINNNEFRANNLITFEASNPDASPIITLRGNSAPMKFFQGNRAGAGRVVFAATDNWLIGGDTDDKSNILIGPRSTLYLVDGTSAVTVRGNYDHHKYRGGWSQGFNLSFSCEFCSGSTGSGILVEHNLFRGGSWPVQDLSGEFRYNLVYGYGHTWLRSAVSGAVIHHNLFAPEAGGGDLNQGMWFYGGETGIQIYNNTFDGGGPLVGDFAGPTVQVSNTSQVASLRNNLITFSRNQDNGSAASPRVVGDTGTLTSADYNAFYSPDNSNHDNYSVSGMSEGSTPGFAAHDVSGSGTGAIGVVDGQLAAMPFAGQRIDPYESVVDEGAVWQRTQKLSTILAAFRVRYTPAAGSPVINAGDPQDNDGQGRRTDIGVIDLNGHDVDKFGKFGPLADLIFRNGFE